MTIKEIRRLLAAAMAALCIGSCARAEEVPALLEPVGVQMAATEAVVMDISKLTAYNGAVVPYVEALCFAIDGEIDELLTAPGQIVRAGDLLATLNREEEDRRCESLKEQIDALRTEDLYASRLAQIDREILQLELEALEAQPDRDAVALKRLDIEAFELNAALESELRQMDLARLEASYAALLVEADAAQLIAPFDGRVMFMADIASGSRVGAYAPLIYLADETRLSIEAEYVSESDLSGAVDLYALADGVRLEIEHVPMDTADYLAMVLSGETLKSRFDFIGDAAVSSGQYAAVCMETGRTEDVLAIPRSSLYTESGARYVYVVEDGVRVRREVETGVMNNWYAQILSGLEEGERVYVPD